MSKTLILSLTRKDFKLDTFTVGGPGGGGKDTSNTGVRITHMASGAVGECREERRQSTNKERAFKKMAETTKFKNWLKLECSKKLQTAPIHESLPDLRIRIDRQFNEDMINGNIVVEDVYEGS